MIPRLWNRIATLLKADAHGVVDALEERSLLVKQCLREAELELLQKRARLAALEDEEKRLAVELERCREEILRLDQDVTLALDGDKEELARFAIRRLLPRREQAGALEVQLAAVVETRTQLAERLALQETEFTDLRQHARTRLAMASRQPDEPVPGEAGVSEPEVELELLRRQETASSEARQ